MGMVVGIRPGPVTTAEATAHGQWYHTTALTATTHGPIPVIQTALTPRPASLHSSGLPRITPAAVIQLLPPGITSTIRPVTPAVAFPALPFPLAAVPITPAAVRTMQAVVPAASAMVDLAAARRTTPAVAGVAHRQEAPASAAAPTTTATPPAVVHTVVLLVALPVTPVADITAAAMACMKGHNDLQGI